MLVCGLLGRHIYLQRSALLAHSILLQEDLSELKKRLVHCLSTHEIERRGFAHTLHDALIPQLNVIRMLCENGECREVITAELSKGMRTARGILQDLFPPMLEEMPLGVLIENDLSEWKATVKVDYHCSEYDAHDPPPACKIQVYRLFQEAVRRVIPLCGVSGIRIGFRHSGHTIVLAIAGGQEAVVRDNQRRELPLDNLENRILFLDARYKFKTTSGAGTTFLLAVNWLSDE